MTDKRSLVEPEGVNAGSAEQSRLDQDQDAPPPASSTLGGGRPDELPQGWERPEGSDLDDESGGGEQVGAGDGDGQDAGLGS